MADLVTTVHDTPLDKKRSIDESPLDTVRQLPDQTTSDGESTKVAHANARPPIDYSSLSAFKKSFWARFASIWTRRFCLSLLAGQVVSLCITCTNVTTT